MRHNLFRSAASALILSLAVAVSGCSTTPENRSLNSVHQPVVERNSYVFDLDTLPSGGMSAAEQRRLAGWFEAMSLKYGDKIAVDDPMKSKATMAAVDAVAARWGLIVDTAAPPMTASYVAAGSTRIILTRTTAHVPGCPDWHQKSDLSVTNRTASNYGCAVNSNLAAMVADKEHLVKGATGSSETVVMGSTKAIDSFRKAPPTGETGLRGSATSDGGS